MSAPVPCGRSRNSTNGTLVCSSNTRSTLSSMTASRLSAAASGRLSTEDVGLFGEPLGGSVPAGLVGCGGESAQCPCLLEGAGARLGLGQPVTVRLDRVGDVTAHH